MAPRLVHRAGDLLDPSGQFRVIEHINTGGMGSVYKVEDTYTRGLKAVKECDLLDDVRRKGISREQALRIFIDEARALEGLKHPGIPAGNLLVVNQEQLLLCARCGNPVSAETCSICNHEPGSLFYQPLRIEARYYLVMEYIDGQDLSEKFQGRLQAEQNLELFRLAGEAASILNYLHEHDRAHCDIKPENLRVRQQDGRLFLLDFGLLRLTEPAKQGKTQILNSGKTLRLGTDGYAAPEQKAGQPTTASDIYALAKTTLALATGLDPTNPVENKQLSAGHPKTLIEGLNPRWDDLLWRGTAVDPNRRPTAAQWLELTQAAEPLLTTTAPNPKSDLPKTTPNKGIRSWRPLLLVLVLLVLGGFGWHRMSQPNEDEIVQATPVAGATIYRTREAAEVVRRLDGKEHLRLLEADSAHKGYWFRVLTVDEARLKGYIKREHLYLDKTRRAPKP